MLPFTAQQFFDVFERYNTDFPFAGFGLSVAAVIVVGVASIGALGSERVPVFILGFLWFWAGAVYHIGYFAEINSAAYLFGTLFLIQAAFFVIAGSAAGGFPLEVRQNLYGYAGAILVIYALLLYPISGYLIGHIFPRSPSFGLPCPLTIFTLGSLLWSRKPVPLHLTAIPLIWTVVGSSAAVLFGVWEDLALLVSGVIGAILIFARRRAVKLQQ